MVLVGQLAVMAFGVTDTLVAGRYSQSALAALSVGSAIYISVFVTLMGLLQAMLPMLAELNGSGQHAEMGRVFHQSVYLWILACFTGMTALLFPEVLLNLTHVPDDLKQPAIGYLQILAWALPPSLFFRLYANLNQSLGLPKAVTWVQLLGLLFKIPLSVMLTFGWLGLPEYGVTGCAWASLAVNWLMVLFSFGALLRMPIYRSLHLWRKIEPPRWKTIRTMLRLGIPNSMSVTVEVTSYTLMALLVSRLGSSASASHQIASNMGALLYMVPLSLSIATSARVSYWIGAQNWRHVRQVIGIGFGLVAVGILMIGLLLAVGHQAIASLYTQNPEVAGIASELLICMIAYQAFDAIQVLCFFILRCLHITLAPMLVYSLLLWGVGLYGGYKLAYHGLGSLLAMQSPMAFWLSSTISLAAVAACLTGLLFWSLKNRDQSN